MTKKLTDEEKQAKRMAKAVGKATKAKPAKASAKAKPAKAPKKAAGKVTPIRAAKDAQAPGVGHNSGEINEALKEIFDEHIKIDEDIKVLNRAKKELRARAKEEHSIDVAVFSHEIRMQKLEAARRVIFERGCADLKGMLGIQMTLDLLDHGGDEDSDDVEGDDDDAFAAARRAANQ